jgi:predicted nucleic acid-binding protein
LARPAFDKHVHYGPAVAWFNGLPPGSVCHFCRYTQFGFLRLSTNPKSNPLQTATMTQAWTAYDDFRKLRGIGFLPEPDSLEPHWRTFSQGASHSHHVWNDAYLAALAFAAGARSRHSTPASRSSLACA